MSSSTNPYGPLLGDDEEQSEEQPSPQQPRSRPGRVLTPNTRTAYAARASARRAALRDHNPDGMFPMPSPGSRPSFADVLAGVAASAAPTSQQPQISEDARRSTAPTAPSLGDLAAQQGAADLRGKLGALVQNEKQVCPASVKPEHRVDFKSMWTDLIQSHKVKMVWGGLTEQKKQYAAYRRAKAADPQSTLPPVAKPDYTTAINLFLDELTAHEPKKRLEHHLKAWPMLHDKEMRFQKGDTPKILWDRFLRRRTLVLQQHVRELRAKQATGSTQVHLQEAQ